MKKITLRGETIGGHFFEELRVILDDNGNVVLFPLLYSVFLSRRGETINLSEYDEGGAVVRRFVTTPIGEKSAIDYINALYRFMTYVNDAAQHSQTEGLSVDHLYRLDALTINSYLNETLPEKLSEQSLGVHCAALKSFYSLLSYLEIRSPLEIGIYREAKKRAAANSRNDSQLRYVSTTNRNELLNSCTSQRDRLILRLGFEVGLRTSELPGILLRSKTRQGASLLELFDKLDNPAYNNREEFGYILLGKFTKGGKTREIFFGRALLTALRTYYKTERMEVLSRIQGADFYGPNELLLRSDKRGFGKPIGPRQGSNTFAKYKHCVGIDAQLGY